MNHRVAGISMKSYLAKYRYKQPHIELLIDMCIYGQYTHMYFFDLPSKKT